MEISEGMYVRTEKGEIKKVFQYDGQEDNLIWCTLNSYATLKSSIVKASYNIIDLIEVGDYVNGCLVTRICIDEETGKKYLNMYGSISEWENEDIKSIVTKEMFDSIKYEVK